FRPLTPALDRYLNVHPEKSKSYEIGLKSNFLDHKLELDFAAFHQKFDGFLYRGTTPVNYVNLNFSTGVPTPVLGTANFLANVPVTVNGFEVSAAYRPIKNLYVDAELSYAKGKIDNGLVACNDSNGDGIPDTAIPTTDQIGKVSGGEAV